MGEKLLASTPLYGVGRVAEKLLSIDQLDYVYSAACKQPQDQLFFEDFLHRLNIRYECPPEELARIPLEGPVMVVCNHPFGFAEPAVLASLLLKIRKDFRFLANSMLGSLDFLKKYVIAVDPFGGKDATKTNLKGIRASVEWLRNGGLLVVFPAGEVSSLQLPKFRVADIPWSDTIGRVVRMTSATVIPMYFHGSNSASFHMAGLVHPRLRTALLPRELFNKSGQTISVSVGSPIVPRVQSRFSSRQFTDYLRMRTDLLQTRRLQPVRAKTHGLRPVERIAVPSDAARMRNEIEALTPIQSSGPLQVFAAEAGLIPQTLLEIGRLREVTFRAAGEGTGRKRDLDQFDNSYMHLFVWNPDRSEVAGAYRIGLADSILAKRGTRGLYVSTLFNFTPEFLAKLGPALELGRSFVREEYQREYLPLLLLWKGIGQFVVRNPQYRALFGPVSISNDYRSISRALMVEFFNSRRDPEFGGTIQPKVRFQAPLFPGCDRGAMGSLAEDVEELSELIADLEPDKKGIPVLLRQYLNMGGKVIDFSLDRQFSNAVDGLIFVDLLKADRRLLARYMGREGLASFYKYHGAQATLPPCEPKAS